MKKPKVKPTLIELLSKQKVTHLSQLLIIVKRYKLPPFNPKEIPQTPPPTPEMAMIYRTIALYIIDLGVEDELKLKARWQNYWLTCCRSSKCDYIFLFLKDKVNREADILELWNKEKEIWKTASDSNKVREIHRHAYSRFLLRRYAIKETLTLLDMNRSIADVKKLLNLFAKLSVRIFVGLIVGYFFSILTPTLWELVMGMRCCQYFLSWFFLFIFSFLYLWYECYTEVEYRKCLAFKRFWIVAIINLVISYVIAFWLVYFLKNFPPIFLPGKYSGLALEINLWYKPTVFFAVLAMFLSIFIQHFWQEKTVPEPF